MPQNRPDPQKEVSDYLARKLGVSRAESEAMPDAIAAIVREPQAGIEALFAALNRSVPRRIEQHIQAITTLVGTLVPATAERVPGTERERIESAVEEAVRLGIVRQEVFAAERPTDRVAYLLSSSHYGIADFDPAVTPPDVKQSQVELFRLAYLLNQKGVQSPMRVEGRTVGHGYTPFRGSRPVLETAGGRTVDVYSPEAQRHLFEHPETLLSVMDEHQRRSAITGMSTPVFYDYATGLDYRGAHSPATGEKLDEFARIWLPWEQQFLAKWRPFFNACPVQDGQRTARICTGWDERGTPMLEMLPNQWHPARDVAQDMAYYLRYANLLNELDVLREREMAELMLGEPADKVPMAFAGKAHELMVVRQLRPAAEVRVLTPMASIRHDSIRRTLPVNDPRCTMLHVDLAAKLHGTAISLQPRAV